jgi:hypothetical protein
VAANVAASVAAPTSTGTVTGTCSGGSTGVIRGGSTGGILPITYTLVNQVTSAVVAGPQADSVFNNLAAGTYIVRVTDACGVVTNSSNLLIGDLLTTPTISTTSALDCSGSAQIGTYGGGGSGGPYTYAICSGAACTGFGAFGASSIFTVTSSGTYRVAVRDRCGLQTSSADIVITLQPKPVVTGVTKANSCGTTTLLTINATGVPNTAFYSVDGANFSTTLPSLAPGCHTIRVADNNAGTFGCASDAFDVSVFAVPTLTAPSAAQVNCTYGNVIIPTSGGNTGCVGSGASLGVKLVSCTGCSASALAANPIGTIKNAPSPTFLLGGSSVASFTPVISVGGSEVCAGGNLSLNFLAYCAGLPLPIKIEYFTGKKIGNTHKLDWKVVPVNTANGTIVLENSPDGISFKNIYTVTATALQMQQPFSYTNEKPLSGINYYRIKLIDDNGIINYSNIVALTNINVGIDMLSIAPNPTINGKFKLNITSSESTKIDIVVSDLSGRIAAILTKQVTYGFNPIEINLGNLAKGVYQLNVISSFGKTKAMSFVND